MATAQLMIAPSLNSLGTARRLPAAAPRTLPLSFSRRLEEMPRNLSQLLRKHEHLVAGMLYAGQQEKRRD